MFKSPIEENAKTACAQTAKPFRTPFATTLAVAILSVATTASAQDNTAIGDLPHALICAKDSVTVVGYLARVNSDGSAVYMTPSNIIVEVSAAGVVDSRSDGTCAGKSLDELRDSGQAREFPE